MQNSARTLTKIRVIGPWKVKTLVNITRRDSRTKRKKGNVRCAIRKVRDQRGFTGGIGKTDALKVANIEKKVLRIESMMCSVSCSDKSVERTKYATTHAVKSLMKTEGEEERERMQRKKNW